MTRTTTVETDLGAWMPGVDELQRSRLLAFVTSVSCADIDELHARAGQDPAWFWDAVSRWLQLDWEAEPSRVVDQFDEPHATRWFIDARFNLADNAVDRWVRRGRGGEKALVWETEAGQSGSWTFDELLVEVDRVGQGLLEAGLQFGDTVGIQLPMVREAVVAQLACAKIGAIAVPIFSGFGAGAVGERLRIAGASAHIVANGFERRGRVVSLRKQTAQALENVPTLRTTVVVSLVEEPTAPVLPGEVSWAELGRGAAGQPLRAASCPADHPLFIAFTSGTTGAPKGVVLGHAGFAVKAGSDAAFSFDIGPGDLACWITDPGWIMSPITVLGGLIAGSAVAVYGGSVDHPDGGRLWRLVRERGITMLGVSPTLVRSLMGLDGPAEPPDLGSLRVFASSGEPWTPDAYSWLFSRIGGGRLPVINYSGGTEVSGGILSNTTAQPIRPCAFAGPLPGMGADVVDADGASMGTGLGELALRNPSPGMPLTFWGAHERYRDTYWTRWEGTWFHGDWVEVDEDGVWYIRGRSDDTLKIAGKRLGPAEVEAVANGVAGVRESAAIGVPDPVKGEALVVFVKVSDGSDPAEVVGQVSHDVARTLGKPLSPKAVHVVDDLPHTRSGKILRRLVRSVYLGDQPGDLSSLENPEALDMVRRQR